MASIIDARQEALIRQQGREAAANRIERRAKSSNNAFLQMQVKSRLWRRMQST